MYGPVIGDSIDDGELRRNVGWAAINRWTELNPPPQDGNETEEGTHHFLVCVYLEIIIRFMAIGFQVWPNNSNLCPLHITRLIASRAFHNVVVMNHLLK